MNVAFDPATLALVTLALFELRRLRAELMAEVRVMRARLERLEEIHEVTP